MIISNNEYRTCLIAPTINPGMCKNLNGSGSKVIIIVPIIVPFIEANPPTTIIETINIDCKMLNAVGSI